MKVIKTVSEINQYSGTTVNPLQNPQQTYELYSVPSFDNEYPEIVTGAEIGSSKVTVEEGDVLICKINPRINRVWVVKHYTEYPLLASSEWIVIRNKSMDPNYLKWYFSSPTFRVLLNSEVAGIGGSLTRAQPKQVSKYPIPIPEIDEQKEIAAVLDKVSGLIALRKKQLQKLDELVKARFVEMFGDQETNPYKLDVGKLSDVADIYLGLTHTPTYVEQGRPFLSVRDISSGVIDFSNCHYITEDEFSSLPNGARPKIGDMLFCRVGTIGKPVVIPENTPEFGTFVSVGYLRKKANVNNFYLKSWMENDYFMRQVYDNVAGASQINLNTGWLKNFRILIPAMELQDQFAAFVEQTDKSKLAIQNGLERLELMKKALMQKYFG